MSAFILAAAAAACLLCAARVGAAALGYDYSLDSPTGPLSWGSLRSDWSVCSSGSKQSPVNVSKAISVRDHELQKLHPLYSNSCVASVDTNAFAALSFDESAGVLIVNDTAYRLAQVQVHIPGEHVIDNRTFPMEVHLVHNTTVNTGSRFAILSFHYKLGSRDNAFVAQLVNALNRSSADTAADINPMLLKTAGRSYYKYEGSLTTPPCTESVDWYLVKKNRRLSKEQLQSLSLLINGTNARPVQPLNGRPVLAYK